MNIVTGKVSQRQTILVESHPEENHHSKHQAKCDDTFFRLSGRQFFLVRFSLGFYLFLVSEHLCVSGSAQVVNSHRDDQRKASHTESIVVRLCHAGTHVLLCPVHDSHSGRGGKEGTNVDGHIEDRECRVALSLILGVIVKVTHHNLQVTLEQARTERYQRQCAQHTSVSNSARTGRNCQQHIAQEHNYDTQRYHLAVTEFIGQNTADKGQEVHEHQER